MTDLVDSLDARYASHEEIEQMMQEAHRLHERHMRDDATSIVVLLQKAVMPRTVPSVVLQS